MLIVNGRVAIRNMKASEEDFSLLYKWLNDERVLRYIEGPSATFTYDQITRKYGPRARGEHYVTPCMIECDQITVGYLQFYPLQADDIVAYGARPNLPQFGMDIFIGEPEYWNQGVGTTAVRSIIHYLFTKKSAADIYIEPQTANTRAIHSYEKCGFTKVKVLPEHEWFDGVYVDNQLMRISRETMIGHRLS
ncbi:GNAT family N-acetyltransferase [Paenibacillus sp. JCM 10914]|uniref:GNAT family N-acetyltransferase n=1 Tax=Paenibacillus sp. JCM 10914 TaxID=1236974 RepID=UPI0003CCA35F|nr:GNAT family N-acetyltransferase [Paenibacillus sp. JCM 10914]GAE07080.1 GCN5-related N-acetyltransferase [Paenibacillus sp. JCM 10914]